MISIQISALLVTLSTAQLTSQRLSYKDHGLTWGSLCSAGLNQSPINIDPSYVEQNPSIYF